MCCVGLQRKRNGRERRRRRRKWSLQIVWRRKEEKEKRKTEYRKTAETNPRIVSECRRTESLCITGFWGSECTEQSALTNTNTWFFAKIDQMLYLLYICVRNLKNAQNLIHVSLSVSLSLFLCSVSVYHTKFSNIILWWGGC